jgi:Holliday junction resolvase
MVNKKIGNFYEEEFKKYMASKGYWVHLLANNKYGQPFDVIAVKDNKAWFIDVKHCASNRFVTSRIEANQQSAFEFALECGNRNCGFAIYFEVIKEWKFLPYMKEYKTSYHYSEL